MIINLFGEIFLLPLDTLKIKNQINPEYFKGKNIVDIVKQERWNLYSGWKWTILRNAPGAFTLFGSATLFKSCLFDLDINDTSTLFQHFIISSLASTSCILVSSPMDVTHPYKRNANS